MAFYFFFFSYRIIIDSNDGISWKFVKIHELPWNFMELHEISRKLVEFHENAWDLMKFHEIPSKFHQSFTKIHQNFTKFWWNFGKNSWWFRLPNIVFSNKMRICILFISISLKSSWNVAKISLKSLWNTDEKGGRFSFLFANTMFGSPNHHEFLPKSH